MDTLTLDDLIAYLREARDTGSGAAFIRFNEDNESIEHGTCGTRAPMDRSRYGNFAIAWMSPPVVRWQAGRNVPVEDAELPALAKKWRASIPTTFRMVMFRSPNWGGPRANQTGRPRR